MAILYGFTRDEGFAIVDTDMRVCLYGYPSSPIQVAARTKGARKTAESLRARLAETAAFAARILEHNGTVDDATYRHVYGQLVAPQALC